VGRRMKRHYSEEHDILYINWGGETEYSIELFDGELILDLNKKAEIVGMEIFNFKKQVKKHEETIKKILDKKNG
jgi:uncharacterized protein YuzE